MTEYVTADQGQNQLDSPAMAPYVKLAVAAIGHGDLSLAIEEISGSPLETLHLRRGMDA